MSVQVGQRFRHFVDGRIYEIVAIGSDCDGALQYVTYRDELASTPDCWTRPWPDFTAMVQDESGNTVPRFAKVVPGTTLRQYIATLTELAEQQQAWELPVLMFDNDDWHHLDPNSGPRVSRVLRSGDGYDQKVRKDLRGQMAVHL